MLHIPILRKGRPYYSVDSVVTKHHRTGEPLVRISMANSGLIRRDLSLALKERVMQAGLVLLLLFMGAVIYLDISKNFFH